MPSKQKTAGPTQSYQRFAWITLALAGMVALFSADRADPAAAGAPVLAGQAPTAPAPAAPRPRASRPAATSFADADTDTADETPGESGDEQQAARASEPGPAADPDQPRAAGPASAAEAGQLLASSRNRSGGIDQGDEVLRRPPVS